jgi:hypothetical protein
VATTQDQITANLIALGFTNQSAEAIYNKFAEAAGIPVDNTLTEIANSQSIITNLLISQYGLGKALYYVQAALAFQYGDDLSINMAINPVTGMPYLNDIYDVVDPTKQIIAQAAFEEIPSGNSVQLVLKVATTDTSGNLAALSPDQLTAFTNYFLTFQLPGLPVSVNSTAANVLNFNATATYISAYDLPTLQANIASALTAYQVQPLSQVLPGSGTQSFNGVLYIDQLSAYVEANSPGLKDFFCYATTADGVPFSGFVALSAGYFNYDGSVLGNIVYNAVTS